MSTEMESKVREAFEADLPVIRDLIQRVSRRHFGKEEREDFSSYALLRIMENDFAVLRKFCGKSSLRTYLTVVIHRFSLDYRICQWHKWRPTAKARRLGPVGVKLDRLMNRDGHSAQEAVKICCTGDMAFSQANLLQVASRIPRRARPRFEALEVMPAIAVDGDVERRVLDRERAFMKRKTRAALARALAQSPAQDRLVLKMRYQDGLTVRKIAEILHLPVHPLYHRLERCLKQLKSVLEQEGVIRADAVALIGWEEDSGSVLGPNSPEVLGLG